ncbi:hypothetical protein E2C01_028628 [Portunus trituberculatus]|uniref:Uncharacterized protein n=1 Tax=Portunus trituberculatus TaxID=210409 RepID=A0A5B7EKY8_PORTR|nr:hypothetical protein [Portunus trituberculatus]
MMTEGEEESLPARASLPYHVDSSSSPARLRAVVSCASLPCQVIILCGLRLHLPPQGSPSAPRVSSRREAILPLPSLISLPPSTTTTSAHWKPRHFSSRHSAPPPALLVLFLFD